MPELDEEHSDTDEGDVSDFYVQEEGGSSENEGIDVSEWEPVTQKTIALDYSNVPVFLKTLRDWRSDQTESASSE